MVHIDILNMFKTEFDVRVKKRKDKEKTLKKELKIEYDEMLAHSLYVEEINAKHHLASQKQTKDFGELFTGPRVGGKEGGGVINEQTSPIKNDLCNSDTDNGENDVKSDEEDEESKPSFSFAKIIAMSSTIENPFPTLGGGPKNPGSLKASPIKTPHPLSILNKPVAVLAPK
eukprot:CAMPEP_0119045004 /NCGR_PEP_ID=MMETSP1177-20130426/36272_1 /TAXON_ID=2985 /ORGANISM="Ochromonas sp, Strain CCMP1899" /LENGTH=171 /DNA_ID=CAMNT_0007016035 /DNA_START=17 /DNA_END=529 /DNA_ORIENTATION=+